jgi:sec-independent protein translocase protein TatC
MPFLDHLEELRWRLLWSLLALVVCSIAGLVIVTRFKVLHILTAPIEPYLPSPMLNYAAPQDAMMVTIKLALFVGLLLAFPIIAAQIWAFLSPALQKSEKRAIIPALYFGLLLFVAGVTMGYAIVLPASLEFMMGFQTATLEPVIMIGEYMNFATSLLVAFGIAFELPVVIISLTLVGLVTPEFLSNKRRHALAVITVVSAENTPVGDVVTMLMMMVPLALLYELSIILSKVVVRRRSISPPIGAEG